MKKIMNIYGVEIDENNPDYNRVKQYREDASSRIPAVVDYVKKIISSKIFDNGFYIFVHKTKPENIDSIVFQGLDIRDNSGHIEFTLERVFNSTSSDFDGDLNYLCNSISNGNLYGNSGIIVLLPKNYDKCLDEIIDTSGKHPKVKSQYIMGTFKQNRVIIGIYPFRKWIDNILSGNTVVTP